MSSRQANTALRTVLCEAGWGPESFAGRIRAESHRQGMRIVLHDKTPYSWLREGSCPREPIPQLAATLLSQRSGRRVTPGDLGWQITGEDYRWADDGLSRLWFPGGARVGLEEVAGEMRRRNF